MPRWVAIFEDDLKAAAHGDLIDAARTTAAGAVDPVQDAVESAVARVRRAVAAGNPLDTDTAKVPRSLKAVTVRIAIFALMERIGQPLSEDQRNTSRDDISDLKRIADRSILVEAPDVTDAASAPKNLGTWNSEPKLIGRTHPVPLPGRQYPAPGAYANPDAPEDHS
jgi:hypothetical protein